MIGGRWQLWGLIVPADSFHLSSIHLPKIILINAGERSDERVMLLVWRVVGEETLCFKMPRCSCIQLPWWYMQRDWYSFFKCLPRINAVLEKSEVICSVHLNIKFDRGTFHSLLFNRIQITPRTHHALFYSCVNYKSTQAECVLWYLWQGFLAEISLSHTFYEIYWHK